MHGERIIVGLSGGVDSAVAALRLCEQGHRVEGLFMKNWEGDDTATHCSAEADLADARQVCETLDIPLHQVNFAREYREQVFAHCLDEFRAGRTPNPDVLCNRHIKFGAFLRHARRLGAERIATGHYAAVRRRGDVLELHRANDHTKDQSYFLYMLDPQQLSHACFPLAGIAKREVRQIAADAGFDNFAKKDSTGICFIGERDFAGFMRRYIPAQRGEIVTADGEVIGEHDGIALYTLGQRRGLCIGGLPGRSDRPWYVVAKDCARNRLVVGQGHDHPGLYSRGLTFSSAYWTDARGPADGERLSVQIRYRQAAVACRVHWYGNDIRLDFATPQRAVVPGQAAVLYRGTHCIGGGAIERTVPAASPEEHAVAIA